MSRGSWRRFDAASLRVASLVFVAALGVGVGLATYATDALHAISLSTVDVRFGLRGNERPPNDVVIVGVDQRTFDELGLQWPFPRRVHARVLDNIARDRPRAVAFDVVFSAPSHLGQKDDIALLEAIQRARGRTVVANSASDATGGITFLGSAKGRELLRAVGSQGTTALPSETDGSVRRLQYQSRGLKSFPVATAEVATGEPVSPLRAAGTWIDYYGPAGALPEVPYWRVDKGTLKRGYFQNKVVVIGAVTPVLQDIHPTPTTKAMSGPEIQASAIETVLRGLPLRSPSGWVDVVLIVLLAAAVPLLSLRLGLAATVAAAGLLVVVFVVAAQLAFDAGWIVTVIYPLLGWAVSFYGTVTRQLHYAGVDAERERVRALFAGFVPEAVADQLMSRARNGVRLEGTETESTVMFCDLRDFTAVAERLPAVRVIELLNEYLGALTETILAHGGTLVTFMGDGVMAVFGAPIPQPNHADRALVAAREILRDRLPKFNEWLRSERLDAEFKIGIGLSSGPVMSGSVGSEKRFAYTAVGDTTNTAARLESLTKGTNHQLFMADGTRALLQAEAPDLVFVDEFNLRGRETPVKVWSLTEAQDRG